MFSFFFWFLLSFVFIVLLGFNVLGEQPHLGYPGSAFSGRDQQILHPISV